MLINSNKRYLLSRPKGGINDALVQLEKTYRYAERYGRTLIVDLSRSGLQCNFDDLFVSRANINCEVISWSDELGVELEEVASVHPTALTHRISTYRTEWNRNAEKFCDVQFGIPIEFDFEADYPDQLLVYEQGGGAMTALCVLRRVSLTTSIANAVARRLLPIGQDYDAIHVRHSDYRTDFRQLFLRAKAVFRGRRLLLCSDSREVKEVAATYFDGSVNLLSIAETPDTNGAPLHYAKDIDRQAANIDLLSEVIAMARAKRFLFTQLSPNNTLGFYYPFSGIATLVTALRADPDVIKALFDNADPSLVRQLFFQSQKRSLQWDFHNTVARLVARVFERRWNRAALRRARTICRRVRRTPQIEN